MTIVYHDLSVACPIYVHMVYMTQRDCRSTQSQSHEAAKPGGDEEVAALLRKPASQPWDLIQVHFSASGAHEEDNTPTLQITILYKAYHKHHEK